MSPKQCRRLFIEPTLTSRELKIQINRQETLKNGANTYVFKKFFKIEEKLRKNFRILHVGAFNENIYQKPEIFTAKKNFFLSKC
jgi:hypothetical protein